jgi:hypothetical protein
VSIPYRTQLIYEIKSICAKYILTILNVSRCTWPLEAYECGSLTIFSGLYKYIDTRIPWQSDIISVASFTTTYQFAEITHKERDSFLLRTCLISINQSFDCNPVPGEITFRLFPDIFFHLTITFIVVWRKKISLNISY